MFDIVLLRTFEAVAGLSSFTKAGQQLNLTQSAVSSHIRRLEEQARAALFERSTRTVAREAHSAPTTHTKVPPRHTAKPPAVLTS